MSGESSDFVGYIDVASETFIMHSGNWNCNEIKHGERFPYKNCISMLLPYGFSEKNQLQEKTDLNLIKSILKKENEHNIVYSFKEKNDIVRKKKITFIWLDDNHSEILVLQSDITTVWTAEQEFDYVGIMYLKTDELELVQKKEGINDFLVRKKYPIATLCNFKIKNFIDFKERDTYKNAAKSDFVSRISHDIHTPLGAISNITDFAFEDINNPDKLREDLHKIQVSNEFLLSLINDVLDISKIDSGKIELHPEAHPYDEYISNIQNMFEPLCAQKGSL